MENKYESRWGKFHLDGKMFELVRGDPNGNLFKQLISLTSQILIVEAKHNPFNNRIEYVGISPLFDKLEEGEEFPEYELEGQVVETEDGHCEYQVKAFRRANRCSYCGHSYKEKSE